MKHFKQIMGVVLLTAFIIGMGKQLLENTSALDDNLLFLILVLLIILIVIMLVVRVLSH